MLGSFLNKIVRWASVVRASKDTGQFPIQQVQYHGKTADCVMVFPYGMHANVDGNALAVMMTFAGNLEDRAAIPTSMTRRSKLASGDVEFYSPVSRSRVTIRANGDVEVDARGNLTATVAGAATVAATSATVTAPTITLNGDVSVNGDLAVSGDSSFTGTMSNAGKDVGATHGHVQGNDSNGDAEQPISGVT